MTPAKISDFEKFTGDVVSLEQIFIFAAVHSEMSPVFTTRRYWRFSESVMFRFVEQHECFQKEIRSTRQEYKKKEQAHIIGD